MPTLIHIDGFEVQSLTTAGFNAGGTKPYDVSSGNSIDTTTPRHGAACLQNTVPAAATPAGFTQKNPVAGIRTEVWSFYVRFVNPFPITTDTQIARLQGPGNVPSLRYNIATGKLSMWYGTTDPVNAADFGPVLSTDTWYLVDWKIDVSSATFSQTATVNGANSNTVTRAASTAADITQNALGTGAGAGEACIIRYDDWIISSDLADYPLGEHAVALLKPTSDGTHNGGTNIMEDTATGTDIVTPGFTTAYTLVNEVPPESTDYILQNAAGAGNYAEVVFEAPPTAASTWGTMYHAGLESNAVGTFDLLFRVVDSGGSTLLDQGGAAAGSGTTFRHSIGYLAGDPTGRKGRVGFATDVTPKPRATMFVGEVAYVPVSSVTAVTLSATPSQPVATLRTDVGAATLTASPTLPAADVQSAGGVQNVTAVTITASPTQPAATLKTSLPAVTLSATPTLPAATLREDLAGAVLTTVPTLPAATLRADLTAVTLATTPTLPTASVQVATLAAATLTITPTLPQAEVQAVVVQQVIAVTLEATPTQPAATLAGTITAATLTAAPSLPVANMRTELFPATLSITASLPAATFRTDVGALTLSATPTFPQASIPTNVSLTAVTLATTPTLPAAVVWQYAIQPNPPGQSSSVGRTPGTISRSRMRDWR